MYLKELDFGKEVKCDCKDCSGTGVYKGWREQRDLGVVCNKCNGRGYYVLSLNEKVQLAKDEKTGIVYEVINDEICGTVKLFNGLKQRGDVKYVMYGTGFTFCPEYLFEHGANEINLISYKEFLNGELPLPMTKYVCPRYIEAYYENKNYSNDCPTCMSTTECEYWGKTKCWDEFYGDAETIEEKREVLKKLIRP